MRPFDIAHDPIDELMHDNDSILLILLIIIILGAIITAVVLILRSRTGKDAKQPEDKDGKEK
ncbi:MAG: hypothetical protein II695_08250 [Oscillospiraceae bacterium]|nr:hypothetical protein [Oscillospiraceae bacterium]